MCHFNDDPLPSERGANTDFMPREGVNGFSLKGNAHQLVDAALQVYARTGMYPNSRALHEAAMAYRAELIRIVSEHRVEHPI